MSSRLAHSAPKDAPERGPQIYGEHVRNCHSGAISRAEALLQFAKIPPADFVDAIDCGSHWHDLGKLAPQNQTQLAKGHGYKLPKEWDHIDAGVAHMMAHHCEFAAWLIRAHHSPGLPCKSAQNVREYPLRGSRHNLDDYDDMISRIDSSLPHMVSEHLAEIPQTLPLRKNDPAHGLTMRLALSCLVDSDHEDSTTHDRGASPRDPLARRWEERATALDAYVAQIAPGDDPQRDALRNDFYQQCCSSNLDDSMTACEGPVGVGKTTAVLANLLRRASRYNLRRIFVVAPYTNIISQTVSRLRKALRLNGEQFEDVVAEHHHLADFESYDSRDFAVLWKSPIVVTTAVQFFETLAANKPGRLRKLHELPGSAVFLDEAHSALPPHLWPQAWLWLTELATNWSCQFIFASGSLIRFWNIPQINRAKVELPLIAPSATNEATLAEEKRIEYVRIPNQLSKMELCHRVLETSGPRLVILNTIQSAAAVALELRNQGKDVFHLSTALCPADREVILDRIKAKFKAESSGGSKDWTLCATSCVEAGVDLSFQTAFREAASVASLIQVGGRVNRHGERNLGRVYSFHCLPEDLLTHHPQFGRSAEVLDSMFLEGRLKSPDPADVVTEAMRRELKRQTFNQARELLRAEEEHDYPTVAELGRVIKTDTRTVIVQEELKELLKKNVRPSRQEIQRGSVQIWSDKIDKLGMEPHPIFTELHIWGSAYEPDFLGYMKGVLPLIAGLSTGCFIF